MSTSYSTSVGLGIPAHGDRSYDAVINADLSRIDALAAVGPLAVRASSPGASAYLPSTSLNVNVAAGTYRKADGSLGTYAGTTGHALTGSTVTYLWLTDAGVLTSGAAWPTGSNIVPLAAVTTGTASVTAIADSRIAFGSVGF